MHVVSCDRPRARNLMLAVERCHLGVEAVVATPYASGLSALVDDEAELGAAVIDMGGGTTSVGIFSGGSLAHVDAFAVGGHHVTMDIARGLTTRLADAERLKTLYGTCLASASDERDTIAVTQVGDDGEHPTHLPKSQLVRIIKPRVEEILELVRDRLEDAGFAAHAGRRIVLTGGASQLDGLPEAAGASCRGRCGSAARSASRACPSRPRAPPSRPPSACSSTRRSAASSTSSPRRGAFAGDRDGRLHGPRRTLAEGQFLEASADGRRRIRRMFDKTGAARAEQSREATR